MLAVRVRLTCWDIGIFARAGCGFVHPALPLVLHPGQAYRFAWQRRVVIGRRDYERPLSLDRPA
jgi:hypothetical protein